ncbi:MAG: hypothetical protein IJ325_03580, partial [Clostridia bacterium]|nr:hypothetical protein [Clostridia bacterium]
GVSLRQTPLSAVRTGHPKTKNLIKTICRNTNKNHKPKKQAPQSKSHQQRKNQKIKKAAFQSYHVFSHIK